MNLSKHQKIVIDKLKTRLYEIQHNPMGFVEYLLYSYKKQDSVGLRKSTVNALESKGLITKTKVNQLLNIYKLKN